MTGPMTEPTALYYQAVAMMLLTVVWMAVHVMHRCLTRLRQAELAGDRPTRAVTFTDIAKNSRAKVAEIERIKRRQASNA
jgi:hypothetical protein